MNKDEKSPNRVVFLFDVDNTLLDNDTVAADLQRHLASEIGTAGYRNTGTFSSNCGPSLGMRITLAVCKGIEPNIRTLNSCFACLIFSSIILLPSVSFRMR